MTVADVTGTIGVFLILIAYFLLLIKYFDQKSLLYLFMNLIGASLACVASILIAYWPFIVLEACWALVSIFGLYKVFFQTENI